MIIRKSETCTVADEGDVMVARQLTRVYAKEIGLSLVDQTKLVTATSELVRNMTQYAGGGTVLLELADNGRCLGVRLTFEDHGPGIPDIELAMRDGYSTVHSLGMGLPGAKRLVHDFEIVSRVGEGTRIAIAMWQTRNL